MLWEEMTAKEFEKAVVETDRTCIIPFGVIEKHGDHMPICTDVEVGRRIAIEAAKIEPAVVFPYYFFGQIACGRHCPGTISIPNDLMVALLDEVCREIARNGFKKIIILIAHGGNIHFVKFFNQCCLREKKDYVVYGYDFYNWMTGKASKEVSGLLGTDDFGGHGGNLETSLVMAMRPELIKMENVIPEEAIAKERLRQFEDNDVFTGIWWYADYPHHFAGDPSYSSKAKGEKIFKRVIQNVAEIIGMIKKDQTAALLQDEFFTNCSF